MARVLIVEDDATIAWTCHEILTTLGGHEARVVTTSATAAAFAAEWHPDAILLDMMMPEVDGWAVAAQLRATTQTASIPLVVMTAHTGAPQVAADLQTPHWLGKPFDIDALLALIASLASTKT